MTVRELEKCIKDLRIRTPKERKAFNYVNCSSQTFYEIIKETIRLKKEVIRLRKHADKVVNGLARIQHS